MLQKCEELLVARIKRAKNIIDYYKNQLNALREKGPPSVFKDIANLIDEEISKKGSKFIKTEQDAIHALVMRYVGNSAEFEQKIKSGSFSNILPDPSGKQRHNVKDILEVALKIVKEIDAESQRKKEKRIIRTQEDEERGSGAQELPDTESHPIFKQISAPITEESFKDYLPGGMFGVQHSANWNARMEAIIKNEKVTNVDPLEKMLEGIRSILKVLQLRKETKRLSVSNFSKKDIDSLKDALAGSMTMINMYKQNIVTRDNKLNKNIMNSIFGDAAIDFFTARYIAVMIKYIEMVFVKSYKETT